MSYFEDMFDAGIEAGIVFDGTNDQEILSKLEEMADEEAQK